MGHTKTLRFGAIVAVAALLLMAAAPSGAAVSALGEGPVAVDRQLLVYELNLARWNPVAYEARAGIRWERPAARPPLALDDRLLSSAQFKRNMARWTH